MSTAQHNWDSVSLAEIVKCQGGAAFSPSLQGRPDGDIPFYKVSDMNLPANQWFMHRANNYVSTADKQHINGNEKPSGAVIFPKVGAAIHTNKKRLLTAPAFVDNNVMAVWSTDPSRCTSWYLYLYFLTKNLSEFSNPGPLPSINNGKIYEQSILLPSVPEQDKIAAVLWKVQRAIDIEEKLIKTARDFKQSSMQQAFSHGVHDERQVETELGPLPESWSIRPFEELREFLQYGTSAKCDYHGKGNPVIRIPNVVDGKVSAKDLKWCELQEKVVASILLEDGDVLFIRTNAVRERVGRTAVYQADPAQALFASYLIRARLKKDQLEPDFLQYLTMTATGASQLSGRASPAADGKFNINTKTIDSILIPLPSIHEQQEIITLLKAIDRKIDIHERKRRALKDLFNTLLNKLMTGEMRVADLDIDTSDVVTQ